MDVAEKYQGGGVSKAILSIADVDADYVVTRTQNPIILKGFQSVYGDLYPVTGDPTEEAAAIGLELARITGTLDIYEADTMISRGIYNNEPLNGVPYASNDYFDDIVSSRLDVSKGDAIVTVSPTAKLRAKNGERGSVFAA